MRCWLVVALVSLKINIVESFINIVESLILIFYFSDFVSFFILCLLCRSSCSFVFVVFLFVFVSVFSFFHIFPWTHQATKNAFTICIRTEHGIR